jgi:phage protein D
MRPIFQINADGAADAVAAGSIGNATGGLGNRLIEISIQDIAGGHADRLSMRLDDRSDSGYIAIPPNGTVYDVMMGYAQVPNQDCPAPLTFMGRFIQDEDEVEKSGHGRVLTINAKSVDFAGPFKQTRLRSYHNMKLGDIVSQIAQRDKLQPVIAQEFQNIFVPHIDQTHESDGSFLKRLYDIYGAVAKVYAGKLLFGRSDGIRELLGESSEIVINENTVLHYRYLDQTRGKYKKTHTKSWNKDKATLENSEAETEGDAGTSEVDTDHVAQSVYAYKDEEGAHAAKSKQGSFDNMKRSIHIEVIGDPYIIAGGTVNLVAFRPGVPKRWHVTKVTHKFDNSGYKTEIEGDTKFKGESQDSGGSGDTGGGDTPDEEQQTDASKVSTANQSPQQSDPESPYDDDTGQEGTGISPEPTPLPGTEN